MGVEARIATAAHSNGAGTGAEVLGARSERTVARPAKVFVVARVRLYREALARLLGAEPLVEVVGSGPLDAGERVDSLDRLAPDVVLVDASSVNDPIGIAAIVGAAPPASVIAFGVADSETQVVALAQAGVAGFVSRDQPFADLVEAVASATRGEVVCSPSIAAVLLASVAGRPSERQHPSARLTARELEIVDLIGAGLTNREIATRLCIEVATVKNHVHNILEKLEVAHRAEAVARVRSSAA